MGQYRKYDDLAIGQVLPDTPALYTVDRASVEAFRAIASDTVSGGGASTAAVAPPMLAAVYIRPAQNALQGPPGGVHAKQSFAFHHTVREGDRLSTTLTVLEKYERKGRNYLMCETRTVNQDAILVTTGRIVQIWGKEDA